MPAQTFHERRAPASHQLHMRPNTMKRQGYAPKLSPAQLDRVAQHARDYYAYEVEQERRAAAAAYDVERRAAAAAAAAYEWELARETEEKDAHLRSSGAKRAHIAAANETDVDQMEGCPAKRPRFSAAASDADVPRPGKRSREDGAREDDAGDAGGAAKRCREEICLEQLRLQAAAAAAAKPKAQATKAAKKAEAEDAAERMARRIALEPVGAWGDARAEAKALELQKAAQNAVPEKFNPVTGGPDV
jgi:hypothetical protein